MRKKKVLVCGTLETLKKFSEDAASREFEIVAMFTEVHTMPPVAFRLIDGIIFTAAAAGKDIIKFVLKLGLEPRKIILWDAKEGWGNLNFPDAKGEPATYLCGLEFHLRDADEKKFFAQTLWWLNNQRLIKNLSPQDYPVVLEQTYRQLMGRPLDLKNPQTFAEKIQWLKIFDAAPIKSRLADKYLVRSWIAEKIGDEYLIPLLGVWDDFDDIDFDALPNQFVLKCNHGSGMNIIVRDKKTFDRQRAREKLNTWLATDYAASYLELHYTRINRKIIAEKFMTNDNLPDLTDYKFLCFDGKIVYCQYLTDRSTNLRLNYFDVNWNVTTVERNDHSRSDRPEEIPPPKNFELMKNLAEILSQGFAFVRVDFYEIDGKIYFGEMTFTPGAGNFYYRSAGTNEYLGSLLKLPKPSPLPKL